MLGRTRKRRQARTTTETLKEADEAQGSDVGAGTEARTAEKSIMYMRLDLIQTCTPACTWTC